MRTPLVETVLPTLAASAGGVEPGRGMAFVDMGTVVDAAARFAVDETLHGRAWAVVTTTASGPAAATAAAATDQAGSTGKDNENTCGSTSKIVDLGDDDEGMWAGKALRDMLDEKKASGDLF